MLTALGVERVLMVPGLHHGHCPGAVTASAMSQVLTSIRDARSNVAWVIVTPGGSSMAGRRALDRPLGWALLLLCAAGASTGTPSARAQGGVADALAAQVEVLRTAHGVPHIYADTFEALGYALGYLQVEDYGERVPRGLLRARGELALHEGRAALDADFGSQPYYRRAVEVYPALQQDTRDVYDGFAAGVNRYLAQHPEEFAGWVADPFTGYDVAALFVYRSSASQTRRWINRLTGAPDAPLRDIERDDAAADGDPSERVRARGRSRRAAPPPARRFCCAIRTCRGTRATGRPTPSSQAASTFTVTSGLGLRSGSSAGSTRTSDSRRPTTTWTTGRSMRSRSIPPAWTTTCSTASRYRSAASW